MPDLTLTQLKKAYDAALEQIAAESFLDATLGDDQQILRLQLGNNPLNLPATDPDLPGMLRMTQKQAQDFMARYDIIDAYQNDATGFSAVALRDTDIPGRVVIAVRSTEINNDTARDLGADTQIFTSGFAFDQILSAQDFLLRIQPQLLPGQKVDLVGYSLSGNIVRTLAAMYPDLVNTTEGSNVVFNATGLGGFSDPTGQNRPRSVVLLEMMDLYRRVEADPNSVTDVPLLLRPLQLTAIAASPINRTDPNGNVYPSPRNDFAEAYIQNKYTTFYNDFGTTVAEPSFAQYFGVAMSGFDAAAVANSGSHPVPVGVAIEGQPVVEISGVASRFDYLNTHSLTLMADSLRLQILFKTIDQNLSMDAIQSIFQASSAASASALTQTAEGDTLEKTMDALRTLFLGPTPDPLTLPSSNAPGSFGNIANRTAFYEAIAAVDTALNGQTFQIVSLVDMPTETLKGHALLPGEMGTAYRYAVKHLNPFAVIGADYIQFHNPGDLDLYDSTTGNGSITLEYLKDRAMFLTKKLEINESNATGILSATYYKDNESGYEIGLSNALLPQMIFGQATDETIAGSDLWGDRLYGGDGEDTVTGNGGDDYIEGNEGNDVLLSGGSGNDTILGGQGDDLLEGGIGADILDGGLDNDILKGGAGLDRYIIRAIDGADTIEDFDNRGVVEFDGKVLLSGLRREGDTANVFHSADGTITLTKSGADLVVTGSGPLTIKNGSSGQLGVRLVEEGSYAAATRTEFQKIDHYIQVGNLPDGTPIFEPVYAAFFDDLANDTRNTAPIGGLVPEIGDQNNLIHAGGGNDFLLSSVGDDQLYGEAGIDEIYGGLGNDRIFGGGGDDQLLGDNLAVSASGGNDYVEGGDGNDFVQGGAGRDIIFGGVGDDLLNGDEVAGDNSGAFDDWLDGGSGNDDLQGGAGSDVLIGGADKDFLLGDKALSQGGTIAAGGADSLDGGSGDDYLDGQFGDDVLVGGLDHDIVNGGDGSDVLYGGAGNDTLSGDLRIEVSGGRYALSEYRGAGGDDLLVGEEGNDVLLGGEGSDVLEAGIGNDSLVGGYNTLIISSSDPLFWPLFTAPGHDWLDAGAGSDVLFGGVGNDTFLGGEGNDTLRGGGGDDVLEGGADDDVLYGEYYDSELGGNNPFYAAMLALGGSDRLDGGAGNDLLYGGDRADTLLGGTGMDLLYGGEGDDILDGGDGDDVLEGGYGDDVVHGGSGNDRFVVRGGQGNDTFWGGEGNDVLISSSQYLDESFPLFADSLLIGGTGDDLYVIDGVLDLVVEEADGGIDGVLAYMDYTLPEHVENGGGYFTLMGNALNNVLSGQTVDGKAGDDTLSGQRYIFGTGSGHDTITDIGNVIANNVVQFLADVSPDQIQWQRSGNDLLLSLDGTADTLSIPSFYVVAFQYGEQYLLSSNIFLPGPTVPTGRIPGYLAPSQVEQFEFADGTVWGAERFGGTMIGDHHATTYAFGRGNGQDTILDFDFTGEQPADVLQMTAGVVPGDVTASRVGDNLLLSINGTSDQLTVQSHFASVLVTERFFLSSRVLNTYQIEQIQFADGTIWNTTAITNQLTDLVGTEAADILRGNARNNTIQGLGGNDWLESFGSDDVLDGGVGNDTLLGGSGSDTYRFTRGDGADVLEDDQGAGNDLNTIQFSAGIAPTDLTMQGNTSGNLVIRINGTTDQLTLDSYLDDPRYRSYRLTFADGTIWDTAEILSRAIGLTRIGTPFNDNLSGTPLNDSLSGLGGNDTLWGDAGADLLDGGSGNDTYYFELGNGVETIVDTALPGEGNRIEFAPGISLADLDATLEGNVLVLSVGTSGDALRLTNFDPTGANGSLVVQTLNFANGTTANLVDLLTPSNQAPTVATPLTDQTVPEDAAFSLAVPANTFADAGDVLTFSASLADGSMLPAWLSFDAAIGTFSGTPDDAQVGTLDLRVTATDTGNLSVSDDFTVTVTNVNEAPTVAAPLTDQQATEDAPVTFVVQTSTFADVDQLHGDQLTYSATREDGTALPSWLSFDATTRTFSGTPLNSDVGTLDLRVTARDTGNLSAFDTFSLTVTNVNDAPTVAAPIADQTAAEDLAFSLIIPSATFADEDSIHGDVLTYSAILANGSPLSTWLSFNPSTRTVSGTPGAGDAGTLEIAVTATDTGTLSETDTFALVISGPLPKTVVGTSGDDVLTGGRGDDTLTGLAGNDTLQGGDGHDLLDGGTGTDTMQGGTGNDMYLVEMTGDVVTELANEGTDQVQTSLVAYTLGANMENLTLTGTGASAGIGNALNNQLTGNSGANLLDGGTGADTLLGGAGDDLYVVDHVGDTVVEQAGEGTLDAVTSSVSYSLSANVEHLVLTGSVAINGTGNELDNVLTGNSAVNVLTGLAGHDTYVIGAGDTVVEAAGGGTDTVISTLSHSLSANVEHLTLVGFSTASGMGNTLDNVLNGLLNLGGNTLSGGAGRDTYIVGAGDTVVEASNGGTDRVESGLTATLGAHVENLTLTGSAAINGTGNGLDNVLVGNSAANTLTGGTGNDTFVFQRGHGQDLVQDNSGAADKLLYDAGINPLDLVISRQANDLRVAVHGSTDAVLIDKWYSGTANRTETIQAGNGQILLSSQVDQLIQAMAGFTTQTGLTWDQAIDQQPQDVQTVLAASWH